MSERRIDKHIFFTETCIEILDGLIDSTIGVNNYSEAVRYAVLSLGNREEQLETEQKLNIIGREVDKLSEMVATGFEVFKVNPENIAESGVQGKEDCGIYQFADARVKERIRRAATAKAVFKKGKGTR